MKLSPRRTTSSWDFFGNYQGRYKTFKVKIIEGSNETFSRKVDHYCVSLDSGKHDARHNSLWDSKKFDTVEEAKAYAIKWIDDFVAGKSGK